METTDKTFNHVVKLFKNIITMLMFMRKISLKKNYIIIGKRVMLFQTMNLIINCMK